MNNQEILNLPIKTWYEPVTIREFLKDLLKVLIVEQESFSGKRPFGDSDWFWVLSEPLVTYKLIDGKCDDNGMIEDFNHQEAEDLFLKLIDAL